MPPSSAAQALLNDAAAVALAETKVIAYLKAYRRNYGPGTDPGIDMSVLTVHALRDTDFAPPPLASAFLRSLCNRGLIEAMPGLRYRFKTAETP